MNVFLGFPRYYWRDRKVLNEFRLYHATVVFWIPRLEVVVWAPFLTVSPWTILINSRHKVFDNHGKTCTKTRTKNALQAFLDCLRIKWFQTTQDINSETMIFHSFTLKIPFFFSFWQLMFMLCVSGVGWIIWECQRESKRKMYSDA